MANNGPNQNWAKGRRARVRQQNRANAGRADQRNQQVRRIFCPTQFANITRSSPLYFSQSAKSIAQEAATVLLYSACEDIAVPASSSDGQTGISLVSPTAAADMIGMLPDISQCKYPSFRINIQSTSAGSAGVLTFTSTYSGGKGNFAAAQTDTFTADLTAVTNTNIYVMPTVNRDTQWLYTPATIVQESKATISAAATPAESQTLTAYPEKSFKVTWNSTSTDFVVSVYPITMFDTDEAQNFIDAYNLSQY